MAEVVLKKVEKQYPNGFKAVHGIDLDIKDGEFMVFVGPSVEYTINNIIPC